MGKGKFQLNLPLHPIKISLTSTILTDEGKELMWAEESKRLTKKKTNEKKTKGDENQNGEVTVINIANCRQVHCSLVVSKSHKCKCQAALELPEFNSANDVFLYKGCMAKTILFVRLSSLTFSNGSLNFELYAVCVSLPVFLGHGKDEYIIEPGWSKALTACD